MQLGLILLNIYSLQTAEKISKKERTYGEEGENESCAVLSSTYSP